jgi:hypothetical protein
MPVNSWKKLRELWQRNPQNLPSAESQEPDGRLMMQFMSDLHLEVGQQYDDFDFSATAPYLILAGDIGRMKDYDAYLRFIARQTARFEKVFLVLGNHEFYGAGFDEGVAAAQRMEKEPILDDKLILLHRTRHELAIGDRTVQILGCILWSNVPDADKDMVSMKINDFHKISGWTIDMHIAQHQQDLAWLADGLAAARGTESTSAVVVTHHAPCREGTSAPEHAHSPLSSAFSTDVIDPSGTWGSVVRHWIFGHTHYTTQLTRGDIDVVSNQRGYVLPGWAAIEPSRDAPHRFDAGRTIGV